MLQMTSRSLSKMNDMFQTRGSLPSPGRSIYKASEVGSDKITRKTRLGGKKSPLRALKGVKAYQEKQRLPGIRSKFDSRGRDENNQPRSRNK